MTILDIPCGYGRYYKYLRSYGYKVFGVYISEELINKAKSIYPEYKESYFVEDMRYFKLNLKVDVVLNWFTSFGYFNDEDNFKTL